MLLLLGGKYVSIRRLRCGGVLLCQGHIMSWGRLKALLLAHFRDFPEDKVE
jgi:hypothetical protein